MASLFVFLSLSVGASTGTNTNVNFDIMELINSTSVNYTPDRADCDDFRHIIICLRHNCRWDFRHNRCVERREECLRFDRHECERHFKCEWNFRRHICEDRF